MNKCLVLFVEGYTEVEFYKKLVAHVKQFHPKRRFDTNIEYRNVKGIGGFKNIALRKFIKEIKPKYDSSCEFTVVLCRDTDVFEFAPKPPIEWDKVEKELIEKGAHRIIHVEAKRSIEDWFLHDLEGILKFLRLSKNTKVSGKNGYYKLQSLYKRANKVYYKGMKSTQIIEKLNIEKIAKEEKKQLKPLYDILGIDIK